MTLISGISRCEKIKDLICYSENDTLLRFAICLKESRKVSSVPRQGRREAETYLQHLMMPVTGIG